MDECLRCGACCASFRVSFYWAEGWSRGLPDRMVEKVNPQMACMAGTNQMQPRCQALHGTVGEGVNCTLYAQRPEPCRQVMPGDGKCREARQRHGLAPLPGFPMSEGGDGCLGVPAPPLSPP
jgi:uncharacterized protein